MTASHRADLHAKAMVIDAVCPLPMDDPSYLDWYSAGGVTALAPTMGSSEPSQAVLARLASWHRLLSERQDLLLVHRADDLVEAKRSDRLGIFFHIQGTDPLDRDLDLINLYKALGVGMIQLTYNVRNHVGDGCEEPGNAGLSRFGVAVVDRLNAANLIVDCSHTGLRTSLEAIERSRTPVVLSHSNVDAIRPSPRNAPDALIQAIASSGGVIGVAGFPAIVAGGPKPLLDDFIVHIDAIVQRVGIDHVGLGIDYFAGQAGVASDELALTNYTAAVASGAWSTAYPPPPYHYPDGIETPRQLPRLTERLLERGYGEEDVLKVLGKNWMRVMKRVWG